MNFRIPIPLLAIFLLANCENAEFNTTTTTTSTTVRSNAVDAETTGSAIVNPELPNLCTVCNCTDRYVNCSKRDLEDHFEDPQWSNVVAKEISFEGNLLVHLTPFPRIVVERLILRHNHITKIDYRAFKELVNLTALDLSYNQLTSEQLQPHVFEGKFSPEAYEPLSKLKSLNLAGNVLQWLHQSIFEHLVGIKVLNLSSNPFGVFDYRTSIAISSLSYLEELDISYCELKELPNLQFHTAKYLRRLNLAGNKFEVLPAPLEEATALEYLRLDDNPIHVIDHANAFPSLTNLKVLSMTYMTNLREIGRGGLSELTSLKELHVRNCPRLKKIDEYAMAYELPEGAIWPSLKKLDISDNALRYLPALLVGRWDMLEELDLMNNEWSCDCENQYLIGTLLPEYGKKLMGDEVSRLICSAPPEHAGRNLTSLVGRHLRCLDLYDARPEKDAAILVGVLIGMLVAIPIGLMIFTFWRRGFFFCGAQGPASFSRAFYKRTPNDDDI